MKGVLDEFVTVLGLDIEDDGLPQFRSSITSTIGKMGALVAGTVSAAAAISAFLRTASDTNASAKFARSIDVGFESLQRLEFGAKRMGVEAGTLDGVLANLFTSARGARFGTDTGAAEAFGALGISVDDVAGKAKDAKQLLFDVADAVFNAQNQDLALNFAESLGFGPQFGEFLKLGSDGIRALGDEAERNDSIISDALGQSAERAKEQIDTILILFRKVFLEIGEPFLNLGEDGARSLLEFAQSDSFDKLEDRFRALGLVIKETIGLDLDAIRDVLNLFPEGFLEDVIKTTLVTRFPKAGAAAAAAALVADNQKRLNGDEGTKTGAILDFLNSAGEAAVQSQQRRLEVDAAVRDSARTVVTNPFSLNPFSDNASGDKTDVQVEVNIQGVTDAREAFRLFQEGTEDGLIQALETAKSRVIK